MQTVLQFLSHLRVRKTSIIQSALIFLNTHFILLKFEGAHSEEYEQVAARAWNIFLRVPYFIGTLNYEQMAESKVAAEVQWQPLYTCSNCRMNVWT